MPRRRIVRPGPPSAPVGNMQRVQKFREELDRERGALNRWMARLRRACNALQKHQQRVARLERRIRQMETT
jgi:hypothetical protein